MTWYKGSSDVAVGTGRCLDESGPSEVRW
jgi:hypothetical protein